MTTGIFPASSTVRSPRRPLPADCHARRSAALRAGLLTLASVIAMTALSTYARAATVATDQPDYHPGQTVTITGSGWEPGETVDMVLHEDPPLDPDLELTSVADANGDFTNTDFTVDVFDIGVTFTLTATGLSPGPTTDTRATGAAEGPRKASVTACADDDKATTLDQSDGTSTSCQRPVGNAATVCRAAAGECDLPETCTGSSATCPADGPRKASGTACTDDGNACTLDQCNGTSVDCQHPVGNAGAVCRAAAAECDLAETCTVTSSTWPADVKKASGTSCTADSNPCTLDQCDGTNNTCQHPAGNAGAACTDDGNPCTLDQCDGTSTSCQHPAGNAAAGGRPAGGDCDVAETGRGPSTTGPADPA